MRNIRQEHDDQAQESIDARFVAEKVGSVTIYERPVWQDVIEASIPWRESR